RRTAKNAPALQPGRFSFTSYQSRKAFATFLLLFTRKFLLHLLTSLIMNRFLYACWFVCALTTPGAFAQNPQTARLKQELAAVKTDISRVLLNLFNNAFYAVAEKKVRLGNDFQPEVSISTRKSHDAVEIRVRDNGNGIPAMVLEKIFQPFFTTKPAGQGTGLGLSLSYDIITKGHGGTLTATTREGEFTEFVVTLPTSVQQPVAMESK
ncbi:MAG: GHKL domain-containing protein, partial [Cytophagaceae bacterium]|nr:GHKL domain-containing protein [Cytophagaceae bacterium]